ncbi:hypothetical protein VTI28DRAFT_930 [Corynascus sepedonium]
MTNKERGFFKSWALIKSNRQLGRDDIHTEENVRQTANAFCNLFQERGRFTTVPESKTNKLPFGNLVKYWIAASP